MSKHDSNQEGTWWIARSENTDKVFYGLCTIAVLLVLTDLVFILYERSVGHNGHLKGHFGFEDITGFHAAYGFMAFVVVVLSGTKLRTYLMRPLNYYDVPKEETHHDDHHGHDHDDAGHTSDEDHAHHDHPHESPENDEDVHDEHGGEQ